MENKVQLRVNGPEGIQPSDRLRNRKRRAMRQVNGYGVGKMADPAVLLVFELIVPVARGLKGERQNERSHQNSYDSECYSPTHIQPEHPSHRCYLDATTGESVTTIFALYEPILRTLYLQDVAFFGDHLVQHRVDEET